VKPVTPAIIAPASANKTGATSLGAAANKMATPAVVVVANTMTEVKPITPAIIAPAITSALRKGPPPAADFGLSGIRKDVLQAIASQGFERPSPVQADSIPSIMAGWDVIAEAPSGSGKTLAYVGPALSLVDADKNETQVLIITHAGVLAEQIAAMVRSLGSKLPAPPRVALCIGGPKDNGIGTLRPHIVVGTPGKLLDLCGLMGNRRRIVTLDFAGVKLCAVDEVDALVDRPEIAEQLLHLLPGLPQDCTLGYFTATLNDATSEQLRSKYVRKDRYVEVRAGHGVRPAIQHFHFNIGGPHEDDWETRTEAAGLLCDEFGAAGVIVFARSKEKIKFLAERLRADTPGSRYTTNLPEFRRTPNKVAKNCLP
jgi:ATP-dependent RNA helicase DeaD